MARFPGLVGGAANRGCANPTPATHGKALYFAAINGILSDSAYCCLITPLKSPIFSTRLRNGPTRSTSEEIRYETKIELVAGALCRIHCS